MITEHRVVETVTITLRCSCCSVPWAEIKNGTLVVLARHHGERHVNVLTLEYIEQLLREARGDRMPA